MAEPASISVIVEWENAARIGMERARRMLRELRAQIGAAVPGSARAAEVIFVFAPGEVEEGLIRSAVEEAASDWPCDLRFLPSPASEYYAQKNHGASAARHALLVFLDSDVVPCAGWLEALLAESRAGSPGLATGVTSVELSGVYSKAMALAWIFPLPPTDGRPVETRNFYANNFAIPRALFARHPFPAVPLFRGQWEPMAAGLLESGHRMVATPAARVLHPPPEGLGAFLIRALRSGYDAAMRFRRPVGPGLSRGARTMLADCVGGQMRVWRDRRRVDLSRPGAVAASAIVAVYYGLRLLGFLFTAAAPGPARGALLPSR
jgi:hypothetical protein